MPDFLRLRHAALAAATVLAVLPHAVPAAGAEPAGGDRGEPGCAAGEVAVVVDFNELGGDTRVACHPSGGTAAEVFEDAGFPLTYARGMQGFVCSVSGLPKEGPCTEGDSYWSLWWSAGPEGWAYATLGADQLEIEPGGHLGFAWHEGEGDAAPPEVTIDGTGSVEAGGDEAVSEGALESAVTETDQPSRDGAPTWVLVAGVVVVLCAAAAVPLLRRRS
ncbi:hypothetical protein [Nocardioides vastitatis]|uniref:DUF4430 domain-containing protein n=1 Tax=Nocardioides vastitatis TaxID=2568655 RepID=A0ABW0ZJ71_9ACTN